MKKLIIVLFLGLAFTNIGFAGYGEDQKGECVKGTDSTRSQEVITSSDSEVVEDASKKGKTK